MTPEQAAALLAPFPPYKISTKPKGGIQLSYVSHADVTERLLQVDPNYTWQPFAYDADGLPKLDSEGNLWIYLTVCGVTRIGYGETEGGSTQADKIKSAIGDAIRNAAMRFGVALHLWQHSRPADQPKPAAGVLIKSASESQLKLVGKLLKDTGLTTPESRQEYIAQCLGEPVSHTQMSGRQASILIEKLQSDLKELQG